MRLIEISVMIASACVLSNCAVNSVNGGAASPSSSGEVNAQSAFQAQKVDVDFVAAWSRYQRGDRSGSGRYLEQAAKTLRAQGGNDASVRGLAGRVKGGSSISETEFEQTFAQSHRAMAGVRRLEADRFLALNEGQAAGSSMQEMAYHTEQSARWSGQPLSEQEQQEVSNLRRMGGALQTGSGYLAKGSGYMIQGTGWVLGKGFNMITRGGERTQGRAGSVIRGTGQGGETGSRWIQGAGGGLNRFGDWLLGR